jgi:ubiquinone/menaquinone biosynthesis C-methylase UbiE
MESEITRGWGFDYGVDESSSTKKISLRTADLNETLPLEDGSVEAAVSLAVLEHVTDYLTCIKEAYRILKPGGLFVATTPRPQGKALLEWLGRYRLIDGREIDEHKRYFEKIDLIQAFKKAGFKDITWRSFEFGFNQIIIGKK